MKKKVYEININEALSAEIYLNINYLEEGVYELNIVHKNKIIKKVTFKKPKL